MKTLPHAPTASPPDHRDRATARQRWPRILSPLFFGMLLAWAWQTTPPTLTRGPYLQNQSATSITLVFRTSAPAAITVRYGPHPGRAFESSRTSPVGTTHAIELTRLRPDTKYFYQVESGATVLAGGQDDYFRTSPPANSRSPFRFLAWGDSGDGSSEQRDVARAMEQVFPRPDFALGLGDLVYDSGQAQNYDPRLFQPYARMFRRMTFWPTMGNHDYETLNGAPYLDAFYLPTATGAPRHPSNTELYYSFDEGMAHFVCADSESMNSDPGSPMYTWISDDLDDARARGRRWLFVFLHHPPYSHGTHDSDTDQDLITIRQNLVPLFEAKGVDMVMAGHSHVYERSYLAKSDAILQHDAGDYTKIGTPNGTIYLVSGCGGKSGSGTLDHPLMATSYGDVNGFNLVDVSWEDVRGSFVERDGRTTDLFRLHKSPDAQPPRVTAVRSLGATQVEVSFDEPVQSGSGATGAENLANYQLTGASVLGATLDSDRRTVVLATAILKLGRGYQLDVLGVADQNGHVPPASQRHYFVCDDSENRTALVSRGARWRYFKGTVPPPPSWTAITFDQSAWPRGGAAFGYGYSGATTQLLDMRNLYASVYLRAQFTLLDATRISGLALNVSFDDGFVAYLNGTEIARSSMPAGPPTNITLASSSHAAGFASFDVSAFRSALVPGQNQLAIEGHNRTLGDSDFWLDAELMPVLASPSGAPIAVLDSDIQTANAPARIAFSGLSSVDPDGAPLQFLLDFGDGIRTTNPAPQHMYAVDGTYVASLLVRNGRSLDSIDKRTIRIHSIGDAPVGTISTVSRSKDGRRLIFSSAGSFDPDGGRVYSYWDFGDPQSGELNHSTRTRAAHAFAAAGTYTVTLALTDDEGSTAIRTASTRVQ